jgi:hypothetical protein
MDEDITLDPTVSHESLVAFAVVHAGREHGQNCEAPAHPES